MTEVISSTSIIDCTEETCPLLNPTKHSSVVSNKQSLEQVKMDNHEMIPSQSSLKYNATKDEVHVINKHDKVTKCECEEVNDDGDCTDNQSDSDESVLDCQEPQCKSPKCYKISKPQQDLNVRPGSSSNSQFIPTTARSNDGDIIHGTSNSCSMPVSKNNTNAEIVSNGSEGGTNDDMLQTADGDSSSVTHSADGTNSSVADFFCVSCDMLLCTRCQHEYHRHHELSLISEARHRKQNYMHELLGDVQACSARCKQQQQQLNDLRGYLTQNIQDVLAQIEARAAALCDQIQRRKRHLVEEVRNMKKYHLSQYQGQLEQVETYRSELDEVSDFATDLVLVGEDSDLLTIGSDVCDKLHALVNKRTLNGVNIAAIKLDVPDPTDDGSGVDKIFGSLVQGVMRCGEADKVATYDIDLPWPTGMAVTRNHDFVVTGKIGALEEKGKTMFYNKQGVLQHEEVCQDGCIPYGACFDHKTGDFLVTNSDQQVVQYTAKGRRKQVLTRRFRGTGRPTVTPSSGHLVVTSSDDKKVFLYDRSHKQYTLPSDGTELEYPHFISSNEQDQIIVSDFKQHCVYVFDSGGHMVLRYVGTGSQDGRLKCPSAVCCDTFGNILIADFMNDRVHLISKTGEFLGFLLTRDNGIMCPNFMTLDQDNNLYVGQYGGEISVFRYLSFVKYI